MNAPHSSCRATSGHVASFRVEDLMRTFVRRLFVAVGFLALPTLAFAQASITGIVRDSSGAVLPGVTVEATSPALIEKSRSAVSDGSGLYRIEDLRPGTYAITFTLAG